MTARSRTCSAIRTPAFEYCEAKCFLALRGRRIVGRIACIMNRRANEKFGKQYMNISHIDFIDDDEVVDALFDAAEAYARQMGCTAVHGPLGFSDMDREGMLIEGFDQRSLFYNLLQPSVLCDADGAPRLREGSGLVRVPRYHTG